MCIRDRCNECQEWNTIEEQLVQPTTASGRTTPAQDIQRKLKQIHEGATSDGLHAEEVLPIQQIVGSEESRIDLHDEELNRLLGGGLVQGSFTLLGGEPGIGKSTLIFQTVLRCPELKTDVYKRQDLHRYVPERASSGPLCLYP